MGINYLSRGWERHILPGAAPTDVDIKQVGCLLPAYREDQPGAHGAWQVGLRGDTQTVPQSSYILAERNMPWDLSRRPQAALWPALDTSLAQRRQLQPPCWRAAFWHRPWKGVGLEPASLILAAWGCDFGQPVEKDLTVLIGNFATLSPQEGKLTFHLVSLVSATPCHPCLTSNPIHSDLHEADTGRHLSEWLVYSRCSINVSWPLLFPEVTTTMRRRL